MISRSNFGPTILHPACVKAQQAIIGVPKCIKRRHGELITSRPWNLGTTPAPKISRLPWEGTFFPVACLYVLLSLASSLLFFCIINEMPCGGHLSWFLPHARRRPGAKRQTGDVNPLKTLPPTPHTQPSAKSAVCCKSDLPKNIPLMP